MEANQGHSGYRVEVSHLCHTTDLVGGWVGVARTSQWITPIIEVKNNEGVAVGMDGWEF